MKTYARGAAALLATAVFAVGAAPPPAATGPAASKAAAAVSTGRRDVSIVIGTDIGEMIRAPGPDVDLVAFKAALQAAMASKPPLISEADAKTTHELIMARIKERMESGRNAAPIDDARRRQVGHLVGLSIGRSLMPFKDEIDLDLVVSTVGDVVAGKAGPIPDQQRTAIRQAFLERMRAKLEQQAREKAAANTAEGTKFLAENKAKKGVFTTPSGLQYMVLRQGAGARPKPSDRVRVNYRGTLLDGTVFDSSYESNPQGVEFRLDQVIQGWTEGVSMMPVGAKYRFWIPSELGYGAGGSGQIGPNATLVFDVELLAIAQ